MQKFSVGASIADKFRPQFFVTVQNAGGTRLNGQLDGVTSRTDPLVVAMQKQASAASWVESSKGPRLLAIHQQRYLVWFQPKFCDTTQQNQPTVAEPLATLLDSERKGTNLRDLSVAGYADLWGLYARGPKYSPLDQGFNRGHGLLSPRSRLLSADSEFYPQNSVHGARSNTQTIASLGLQPISVTNPLTGPGTANPELFIALSTDCDEPPLEVLNFSTPELYEDWREKLSLSPIIFTDFESRYTVLDQHAKEGSRRILKVQNKVTGEESTARVYECRSAAKTKESSAELKSQLLQEASTLIRLRESAICAIFEELCFLKSKNTFLLVEKELPDVVPFSEWFSNTWCREFGARVNPLPALRLMIELSSLLMSLTGFDVVHGLLDKDSILVKSARSVIKKESEVPLRKNITYLGNGSVKVLPMHESVGKPSVPMYESANKVVQIKTILARMATTKINDDKTPVHGSGMNTKSILSHRWKFFLRNFEHSYLMPTESKFEFSGAFSKQAGHVISSLSDSKKNSCDVYDLGILFAHIVYGYGLRKTDAIINTHEEEDFLAGIKRNPIQALADHDPLYDMDPEVISLICRMLDSNPGARPTPNQCLNALNESFKKMSKPTLPRKGSVKSMRINLGGSQKKIGKKINIQEDQVDSSLGIPFGSSIRGSGTSNGNLELFTPMKPKIEPADEESSNPSGFFRQSHTSRIDDHQSGTQLFRKRTASIFGQKHLSPGKPSETAIGSSISMDPVTQSIRVLTVRAPGAPLLSISQLASSKKRMMNSAQVSTDINSRSHSILSTPQVCHFGRDQFNPINKPKQIHLTSAHLRGIIGCAVKRVSKVAPAIRLPIRTEIQSSATNPGHDY